MKDWKCVDCGSKEYSKYKYKDVCTKCYWRRRVKKPKFKKKRLEWLKEYKKTKKYKKFRKEYYQRPEVKKKMSKYIGDYLKTEKGKKYRREYRKRPEVKERIRIQNRKYYLNRKKRLNK